MTKTAALISQSFAGKQLWLTPAPVVIGSQTPDAACRASRPAGVASAVALVGYTTAAATTPLDPAATYVRPDGALLGTGAELAELLLVTGPWLTSDGTVGSPRNDVWTGGYIGDIPTPDQNCDDWRDPAGRAIVGAPYIAGSSAFFSNTTRCEDEARVYCIER